MTSRRAAPRNHSVHGCGQRARDTRTFLSAGAHATQKHSPPLGPGERLGARGLARAGPAASRLENRTPPKRGALIAEPRDRHARARPLRTGSLAGDREGRLRPEAERIRILMFLSKFKVVDSGFFLEGRV